MKTRPLIAALLLLAGCREQASLSSISPSSRENTRMPVSTADSANREDALIKALRSRYPASQHDALMGRLQQRNGVSQLVLLKDPDSQRLFDQITDLRAAKRIGEEESAVERERYRRLVIVFPLVTPVDNQAVVMRRPPKVISGELVDEQYVLLVPPAAQTPEALERILSATPRHLYRLVKRLTHEATEAVAWMPGTASRPKPSFLPHIRGAAIQDIEGIGPARSFPITIDLGGK